MAFPDSVSLIDSFAGVDENPLVEGGNWAQYATSHQSLQRISNEVTSQFVGPPNIGFGEGYWTPQVFGPDMQAWITIDTISAGGLMNIGGRAATPGLSGPYYDILYRDVGGGAAWSIRRGVVGGTVTTLASSTQRISNGDGWGIQILGNTISGWYLTGGVWTQILSATDSNPSTTGAGFVIIGFDNSVWRAHNLFAGTVTTSFVPQSYRRIKLR